MPDVIQKDTTLSVLQDLRKRVAILESFPSGGMTLVTRTLAETALNSFATVPNVAGGTWAAIAATESPTLTLLRPQTVFITSSISFVTNGGTASYGFVRCALVNVLTNPVPGNDINGAPMIGSYGTVTNGDGWTNYAAPFCFTAPAGSYFAEWQYTFNGGATTTLSYGPAEIDLFLLSG